MLSLLTVSQELAPCPAGPALQAQGPGRLPTCSTAPVLHQLPPAQHPSSPSGLTPQVTRPSRCRPAEGSETATGESPALTRWRPGPLLSVTWQEPCRILASCKNLRYFVLSWKCPAIKRKLVFTEVCRVPMLFANCGVLWEISISREFIQCPPPWL